MTEQQDLNASIVLSPYNLSESTRNLQQDLGNNFYLTQDGYTVFEFYAMDISQTFNVSTSFIPVIQGGQFNNVSAIATLNVSSINFSNLFHFITDDDVRDDNNDWRVNSSTNSMYFGTGNASTFYNPALNFHVDYSNASVTVGVVNNANVYINNTLIKQDYVRSLAKDVTGGYAMSEIFTNEKQLFDGVTSLDIPFNTSMNSILEVSRIYDGNSVIKRNNLYLDPLDDTTNVALSCQNLVANLFALNSSYSYGGIENHTSPASIERGQKFLEDLSLQTSDTNASKEFRVFFRQNDVLAVRLTYAPYGSEDGIDNLPQTNAGNQINLRSYKVYLVMDDSMDNYINTWKDDHPNRLETNETI